MEGTLIEPQTPPGTVADLGKKVKAKYPGEYDSLPDDEVGRRVKAKYPGSYDDFVEVEIAPQTPPTAPFPEAPQSQAPGPKLGLGAALKDSALGASLASSPPQAPPSVSGPTSEQQSFERDFKTTGTVSTAPRGEPSVGVSAQPPEPSSTAYALPAENDPIVAQWQKLLDTAPPGLLAQDPKWQGELVDIARFGQVDTQPVFRQFSLVGTVLSDTDPRMQKIMADYAAYGPGKVYSAPEIQARKAAGAWTAKDQARFEQGAIDHQRRVLEGRMLMVSKALDSGQLSNDDVAGDVADIQHGFDYLDHAQTELALRDKDSFSDRLRKAQQARTDAGHGLDATDAQVIAGLVGGTEKIVVKPLLMAWNYLTKVDGQYTTADAMIDAIDEASKDLDALVPTKSKEPVTKEGMNGGLKMVNPGNIIPQLAGASANMAPFLAVGGVGGSAGMALGLGERFGSTAALFGTTYADSYDRFVKDAIEAGSTQSVAEEYAPFAATIEATLMSVNPAATGRSLFGTSVRNPMLESIKDGLTPRTAMRKALDGAMKAGVGGLEMSGLVLATDASKNVVNRAVNEVSGSDLPEKASGEDIANSVMQAFLMGAVFNVGHQIVAPNVKGDAMHMAIMNPEATAAMFSKAAERGDIKPEQAAELAEKFNRMQLIYHGNDLLKEDPETAYKVASRLYEKQENERSLKEAPPDKTILEAKGDPRVARNEEIDKENLKDLGLKLPGETSKPSLGNPTGIVYKVQGEAIAGSPQPPPTPAEAPAEEPDLVKKTVATKRAYEGDFRQEVKDEIQKEGLYREIEKRDEAQAAGQAFIQKVGLEAALDAVRHNDLKGGAAAAVYAEAIKDVQQRRDAEMDPEKRQALVQEEAALVAELGDEALSRGRFGSMLDYIYENTDLGFSAAKIADKWKRDFGQDPPPAVQDLMKQVEDLRAQIEEATKRADEAEAKTAFDNVREAMKRESSRSAAAQRKALSDRIRSLKIPTKGVASSFIVPPQLFNSAVEAVALAVQAGENVAAAITKGIKLIQQSDWYKNLNKKDQFDAEKSFENSIHGVADEKIQEGRLTIPKSVIRDAVERGATDINSLVERVKESIKSTHPDATDREVRDVITGYGRKVNMSKDEIDVEIRKQKRIGRLISALEDVRAQKRPAKNIVERDKIDAKEKALKAELKQAIKDLPPDLEADERKAKSSLEAAKTRALASIEELQRRLKEGDFAAKKGPGVTADAELRGLRTKMQQIREKYELEREKERRRRRNLRQKIYGALMDVLNVPKSLVSSLDFSAPLRQGVILSAGNPRAAMRAGKEMFAQAFSQEKADEWLANLKQTEDYKMMRDSGLYLAEPTMSMNAKEESFMSNLAEKIPIYGQLVKGSGRAYAGYLNKLRADVFMYGTERLRDQGITPENDPKSYTEWAHFINNATGRGRMHRNIESAAPLLNTLMFSPRYLASRVNLMNPVTYARMPKEARKMAMKNMISAIGFYAVVATMLAAGGADTEDDPESSDFGKLRFGNTRYDLMAGFQQIFVFFARMIGHISRGEPVGDVVSRFARSKASPTVGALINLDQGHNMVGEPSTPASEAMKLALPLYVQDMKDVYKDGGATGVATSAIPAIFGVGVQTYKPRRRDSERSDPHETRPSR